jgi:ABC-type multidrug transport system fused ATPase/permease subunit
MADLICVMEEGQIVERGSHEELMQMKGRYSGLYELQAQYYR